MTKFLTQNLPVESLKPHPNNARTHSDRQIKQLAVSIKKFGFTNPVLVDEDDQIVAGHGRVMAAKELGIEEVPVIRLEHLTKDEIRAYMIADNKLAMNSGWDKEILAIELQHLSAIDVDFDVEITGFSTPEIDIITDKETPEEVKEEDIIPEPDDGPFVTQLGDVWRMGKHMLICGDSLNPETYQALLQGTKADMVLADPPYNVPIEGHVCGLGKIKHQEFAMAAGEMTEVQFVTFLTTVFQNLKKYSADGSLHYICMDWRHVYEIMTAGRGAYSEMKNLCVWAKNNGGMGSLYRSQHELVFVFKNGTGKHLNNVELGKHGRYRTNVWQYAGVNTMRKGRMKDLAMHPTVKPVAMVADAIKDCTKRGEIVLDPFAGSGTTIIAAEKTKRIAYGIELEPRYCDVILRRWYEYTGEIPVHAVTGAEFKINAQGGSHE